MLSSELNYISGKKEQTCLGFITWITGLLVNTEALKKYHVTYTLGKEFTTLKNEKKKSDMKVPFYQQFL